MNGSEKVSSPLVNKLGDNSATESLTPKDLTEAVELICGSDMEKYAPGIVSYFRIHPSEAPGYFRAVNERIEAGTAHNTGGIPGIFSQILEAVTQSEIVPEYIYQNFSQEFASLILTVPSKSTSLPENPVIKSSGVGISVRLKNNGSWKAVGLGTEKLEPNSSNQTPEIESISINAKTFSFEEMVSNRNQLLQHFFVSVLGSEEAVNKMRSMTGIQYGSYLYRAITDAEFRDLTRDKTKFVTHNDPSANFEDQRMFDGASSQVKQFASEAGYSGRILRWKVADPLFYRIAGMSPPRVSPLFSHFLPNDMEVSQDGKAFESLQS